MNVGVVVFPGSNCDHDTRHAFETVLGQPTEFVWHKNSDISKYDLIVLPGGFSYGDYLRTGAIARFSPVMQSVMKHAEKGKLVLGICNGFQILTESGLLPGVLMRNRSLKFICKHVDLKIEETDTPFTKKARKGARLSIPIAHGEGNYYADDATYEKLKKNRQILVRYMDNPNGSRDDIAGICNEGRNVFGLMPHPERAAEASLGSMDGLDILKSIIN